MTDEEREEWYRYLQREEEKYYSEIEYNNYLYELKCKRLVDIGKAIDGTIITLLKLKNEL